MNAFTKSDLVDRNPSLKTDFFINDDFQDRLLKLSYTKIFNFLKTILPDLNAVSECDTCISNFKICLKKANEQNLISHGGIPEKNFLALNLISQIINPSLYVESGFFKGSSLLAISEAKNLRKIIGFDPIHTEFMAILPNNLDITLVKSDFSDYTFDDEILSNSLVYFDDHINTANRIIEASDKGFKNLIFDDSCGLMGTVERIYPSMPSLFFIENANSLLNDDKISWSKERQKKFNIGSLVDLIIKKKKYFSFNFDKKTIELCKEANKRILSINKIPDLNDYFRYF